MSSNTFDIVLAEYGFENCRFDVTDKIPGHSFRVSNLLFNDPCSGVVKDLRITFSDDTVRYFGEKSFVPIPLPRHLIYPAPAPTLRSYNYFLAGKNGLEIGGPSPGLSDLGVYVNPKRLDNLVFAAQTIWASQPDESPYVFNNKILGQVYIGDVVDMTKFADSTYDFVFASHVFEHLVNPMKATKEIARVLASEGYCLLVLPYHKLTFDQYRLITPFGELLEHFNEDRDESNVLDHLPGIVDIYDFSRDPGAGGRDNFIKRCHNHVSNRALHVHVFDFNLIIKMLEHFNFKILDIQLCGIHQVVLAQRS